MESSGNILTTSDGTRVYFKDWGTGQPVVFSHGWPLSSGSWEAQMLHLAYNGFRCVAHDRRGHGRSSQPWHGNEMNTYADDLAALMDLDHDQIVPIGAAGLASAKLASNATLKVYPGAPHGITDTHKDQLNADLLAFARS